MDLGLAGKAGESDRTKKCSIDGADMKGCIIVSYCDANFTTRADLCDFNFAC
jgi:hypothetical protein